MNKENKKHYKKPILKDYGDMKSITSAVGGGQDDSMESGAHEVS